MSRQRILIGHHKQNGPTFLEKHSFDCGWYWAFGYLGNRDCHWHIKSIINQPEEYCPTWTNIDHHFSSTWLTQSQWWVLRDLFISAYALKKAAEVYKHGGHQTTMAQNLRIISKQMSDQINADLEKLLDNIWNFLEEEKRKYLTKNKSTV